MWKIHTIGSGTTDQCVNDTLLITLRRCQKNEIEFIRNILPKHHFQVDRPHT